MCREKIDEDRQHTENVSSISSRLEAKLEDINAHIPKKNLRKKKIMKIKTERILLILCKRYDQILCVYKIFCTTFSDSFSVTKLTETITYNNNYLDDSQ